MVALVAEEELGIALEACGEGGVGTKIGGGIYAAIAGGHIEGAGSVPAIEGFHAEVVIIVLGEGAIAVAGFEDGHGDDSGGGDPSCGLDEHGFGNSVFEEAALAAVGGIEDFGDTGSEAKDVGCIGALGGDEAGDAEVALFEFTVLSEAVLEGVPLLFKVAFGKCRGEAGDADQGDDGEAEENEPGKIRDDECADEAEAKFRLFGKFFASDGGG